MGVILLCHQRLPLACHGPRHSTRAEEVLVKCGVSSWGWRIPHWELRLHNQLGSEGWGLAIVDYNSQYALCPLGQVSREIPRSPEALSAGLPARRVDSAA